MTKRDNDKPQWITSGPVAWFCIASVVVLAFSAIVWGFAEARADRYASERLAEAITALKLANCDTEDCRVDALKDAAENRRGELDLSAQYLMASAAFISVVLSALSIFAIAATVWFTREAAKHTQTSLKIAQKSYEDAKSVSRRELQPYLVGRIIVNPDEVEIDHSEKRSFAISLNIENFGQTPCHVKSVIFEIQKFNNNSPKTDLGIEFEPKEIPFSFFIGPGSSIKKYLINIDAESVYDSLTENASYYLYINFIYSSIIEFDKSYIMIQKMKAYLDWNEDNAEETLSMWFEPESLRELDHATFGGPGTEFL